MNECINLSDKKVFRYFKHHSNPWIFNGKMILSLKILECSGVERQPQKLLIKKNDHCHNGSRERPKCWLSEEEALLGEWDIKGRPEGKL
jgi:hypothetical protein